MAEPGIVTLLFTDLVGSTELFDRLGDDAAESVRRTHFALLRQSVRNHGGEEVKNLGDGLMVAFGSAVEAIACALEMQLAVDRHNRSRDAVRIGVRIGLHVGEPIRDESDYFGTAVNVARRLCEAAEGGQVVASALVRDLVGSRGGHTFADLGPLQLKGIAKPLMACEVQWARTGDGVPLPAPVTAAARMPLVARESEQKRLRELWDSACEGRRSLVVVAGEPGIGKTRLTAELAASVHNHGATVLFGRCDEEALAAYQPFVEALRELAASLPAEERQVLFSGDAAAVRRLVPELVAEQAAGPAGDAEIERFRLFNAVDALLEDLAGRAPVLLVLDDLHWADKPTLLLMRHILRSPQPAPLMILGTYRDTELARTHPLAEAIAEMRREALFERISVRGLGEDEVAELVEGLGGSVLGDVGSDVHAQTEGNPFFVQEVVRHLMESGRQAGIPEGVKEVIGRRLTRLSEPANAALRVAAIAGRQFSLGVVRAASGLDEDDLVDALDEAAQARLVEEVPGLVDRYAFAHALVRETLYDEVTTSRRLRMHRRIGEALEEAGAPAAELALHFGEAAALGDVATATRYSTEAGREALAQCAYEEAAAHFERGLQTLELDDDAARRCDLLLALADARTRSGDTAAARADFLAAADLARALNDSARLGNAALGYGAQWGFAPLGEPVLLGLLEEALESIPAESKDTRGSLLERLAREIYFADPERSGRLVREATVLGSTTGGPPPLAVTFLSESVHTSFADAGSIHIRLDTAQNLIDYASRVGDLQRELSARVDQVTWLLQTGDLYAVDVEIATAAGLVDKLRLESFKWFPAGWRAMRALLDGRLDEAGTLIRQAWEIGRQTHGDSAFNLYGLQVWQLRRDEGRLREMVDATRQLCEAYGSIESSTGAGSIGFWMGLAVTYLDLGEVDAARSVLEEQVPDVSVIARVPRDYNWSVVAGELCEVAAGVRDAELAATLYEAVSPLSGTWIYLGWACVSHGSMDRPLGLVASSLERWDDAIEHFEMAIAAQARNRARPYLARTQADYAEMLLTRRSPGDAERARGLLGEARTIATEVGMASLQDRVARLESDEVSSESVGESAGETLGARARLGHACNP